MFTAGVADTGHGVAEGMSGPESGDDLPGRLFTWWDPARLAEVVTHAAFDVERCEMADLDAHGIGTVRLSATRRLACPTTWAPTCACCAAGSTRRCTPPRRGGLRDPLQPVLAGAARLPDSPRWTATPACSCAATGSA